MHKHVWTPLAQCPILKEAVWASPCDARRMVDLFADEGKRHYILDEYVWAALAPSKISKSDRPSPEWFPGNRGQYVVFSAGLQGPVAP